MSVSGTMVNGESASKEYLSNVIWTTAKSLNPSTPQLSANKGQEIEVINDLNQRAKTTVMANIDGKSAAIEIDCIVYLQAIKSLTILFDDHFIEENTPKAFTLGTRHQIVFKY